MMYVVSAGVSLTLTAFNLGRRSVLSTALAWVVSLVVLGAYALSNLAAAEDLCGGARRLLEEVGAIRGLPIKAGFACRIETRNQVESFIRSSAGERLPPSRLEHEEELLRLLGVIPVEYNYFDGMVQLYTSQLGGYYDPKTKTIVMADWMPEALQRTIAAHELTHLLQDQSYSLEKLVGVEVTETDRALARAALIEGDASLVTLDFELKKNGAGKASELEKIPSLVGLPTESQEAQRGVEVPEALTALILFPYEEGGVFAHTLLKQGGYNAIDRALNGPPESTREILHPQFYLDRIGGKKPLAIELPTPPGGVVYTDTLGEFFTGALLVSTIKSRTTRREVANSLVADRAYLIKPTESARYGLWYTLWDSEEGAQLFANYFRIHLQQTRGVSSSDRDNVVSVEGKLVTSRLQLKVAAPKAH